MANPAAVARNFLLRAGSIAVGGSLAAVGLLGKAGEQPPSTFHAGKLCYQAHILLLCTMGLAGSVLLYLALSIHNFPTAAGRTAAVAAAVGRRRRQLIRWAKGTSLSSFYCCVWFAAAAIYVVPGGSICFHGLMWLHALFSI